MKQETKKENISRDRKVPSNVAVINAVINKSTNYIIAQCKNILNVRT